MNRLEQMKIWPCLKASKLKFLDAPDSYLGNRI